MVLRWGIVTAAKICNDFVNAFNSYPQNEGQVIAAIAASNSARAKEFAKIHNIKLVFESYRAMAESKDIDVAYIGSLNPNHYELAKLFLENGKHVLCEKPLCLNSKQAVSLVNLARKKKLFLMEAVWSRFFPTYIALEKAIRNGKLGEVKFVEANFGVPIDGVERLSKKDMGGGAILDLGVYVLQFAQFIFKDEPIRVTATGQLNSEGVDMVDTIVLEYSGGRRAVLNARGDLRLKNDAVVVGTKGYATMKDPFHAPVELVFSDGTVEKLTLHTSNLPYNFDNSAGLIYEAFEVKKCIEQGLTESPRMSLNESLILAKLEDTVRNQVGVTFDADNEQYA